jgi:hypothetical protein
MTVIFRAACPPEIKAAPAVGCHHSSRYRKHVAVSNCSKSAVTAVDCGILDAVIAKTTAVILLSNCSDTEKLLQ